MMNGKNYLMWLPLAIQESHGGSAIHRETFFVYEAFSRDIVWEGEVEVFEITGHPTAKRCYDWLQGKDLDDQGERFVTILEIPPVVSPETAVRTSVVSNSKNSESSTKFAAYAQH